MVQDYTGPAPVERPRLLANRSARISFDSWCEQWGWRQPSEVLGDERERQRYSDQDDVQSYPLRPLAHPFQPSFVDLDTFLMLLSPTRAWRERDKTLDWCPDRELLSLSALAKGEA